MKLLIEGLTNSLVKKESVEKRALPPKSACINNNWVDFSEVIPEQNQICLIKCYGDTFLARYIGQEFIGLHNQKYFNNVDYWKSTIIY